MFIFFLGGGGGGGVGGLESDVECSVQLFILRGL